MFNVEANLNLYGVAATSSVVNAMVNLDELTTVDAFKAPITVLTGSPSILYTAPGVGTGLIKSVAFSNTSSTQVGGVKLYKGSSAIAATQITGTIVIPANGGAIWTGEMLQVVDGTGAVISTAVSSAAKNYSARVFARQTWR